MSLAIDDDLHTIKPLATDDDIPIELLNAADASILDLAEPESDVDKVVKQLDINLECSTIVSPSQMHVSALPTVANL